MSKSDLTKHDPLLNVDVVEQKNDINGAGNGQSANTLYRKYKAWFVEKGPKDKEPMPFSEWVRWAQERGLVNKLSADGEPTYDFKQLAVIAKALPDEELKSLAAEMIKAKQENWDKDKLLHIYGPTGTLMISDQATLDGAYVVVKTEVKSRGKKTDVIDLKPSLKQRITIGIIFGLATTFVVAAIRFSVKG